MDSYRPSYRDDPPPPQPPAVAEMFRFGERKRYGFSFKPKAYERDLLTQSPSTVEKPMLSTIQTDPRFRDVDNLTDSDEADMDEDSDREEDNRGKRRKLESGHSTMVQQSAWSNPDPYTSLPPAPEATGKRVDVVKLIRKARNELDSQHNSTADQNDFISFDEFDDPKFLPPPDAPLGPRTDRYGPSGDQNSMFPEQPSNQALGKRKRAEFEADQLMGHPSRQQFHANGIVLFEWREAPGISSAPWIRPPNLTDSAMVALHKEVLDFYAWVKPQEYESIVRQDLVHRLDLELNRLKTGELKAFGSYAAGLYLPTGDMDLVYFTRGRSRDSGIAPTQFSEFVTFLRRSRLVKPGSVKPIGKARVPIIKFVDSLTGLKVDLSFHNTTGVVAIDTFKKWQVAYPAMPIIVSVIKQFLMIRGLNDNSVGGLGGFSTICMVTSLVQHMPSYRSPNLGELLIEFLNLYGNLFDFKNVGIRLDPPSYVRKDLYTPLKNGNEKADRLMIVDPNRPDNNISGGSSEVRRILALYSKAYDILLRKLDDFATRDKNDTNFSFLGQLVGGNFTAYNISRQALHAVYQQSYSVNSIKTQPLPPPPPAHITKIPPSMHAAQHPPPPKTAEAKKTPAKQEQASQEKKQNPVEASDIRFLKRLRKLRPDLLAALNDIDTISRTEAARVGGYSSPRAMHRDLEAREGAFQRKSKKNGQKT